MEKNGHFITLKTIINQLVSPPEYEWEHFESLFNIRHYKAGDYFIRAGEESESLGFINVGLFRFFYQTPKGTEFNKSFAQENGFIAAYSAYLTKTPARFNIQALENGQVLVANLAQIVSLYDKHPCWERLGRLLAQELYIKKEQREAEFLLDDAETRYRSFQQRYPGLEDRLTQYHVASYLGITPVALSRIRKKIND
jgi:CRP-like cAMP-binding protein